MNPNVFRRLICIIICLIMVLSVTAMVFADELEEPVTEDPIEEYQYANSARADITISNNGTATFTANAKGQIGIATKISGTCYLQKLKNDSWTNIKSVGGSTNSLSLTLSSTKSNLANGKYRTHAVFKVYSGSNYETVTVNSSSVNY